MGKLSQEILHTLFQEELRARDESDEAEIVPAKTLSGMGSSSAVGGSSKYEGFGNSPINKIVIGDSLRNMVDSVLEVPDAKKQILDMCLANTTGDYQAVQLTNLPEKNVSYPKTLEQKPKIHTPGRAGGGWEEDEEERYEFLTVCQSVKENLPQTEDLPNSEQHRILKDFCSVEKLPVDIATLDQVMLDLSGFNPVEVLIKLNVVVEEGSDIVKLRSLLLVERYLQGGAVSVETVEKLFEKMVKSLNMSDSPAVIAKTKKIGLIIESLKRLKRD